MDLSIRPVDTFRLAAIVQHTPAIDFRTPWTQIRPILTAQGLLRPDSAFLSAFKATSMGLPGAMEWYAAAMILDTDQPITAPLEARTIDAGKYVTCTYEGPYQGMGDAWGRFMKAIAAAGHPIDLQRAWFERYVTGLDETSGSTPRTELYAPLAG